MAARSQRLSSLSRQQEGRPCKDDRRRNVGLDQCRLFQMVPEAWTGDAAEGERQPSLSESLPGHFLNKDDSTREKDLSTSIQAQKTEDLFVQVYQGVFGDISAGFW